MIPRIALVLSLFLATPLSAAKRALLVGVNDYTYGPAAWDLRGCANDVEMVRELLIDRFGFPAENVEVMFDSEATAQRILQAIQDWLVAPGAPEDVAYFHFSGHGSQVYDFDHDEEDDRDELICPADMEQGRLSSVITDDQLKAALQQIPARSLTVVLDACHSGTGTRDLTLSRPRFVVFDTTLSQTRGLSVPAPAPSRDKLAGSGGIESGKNGQVTISGCAPEQTSADAWIRDGFYAGALTYYLVENMKKATPDLSYRGLMERVVRDLQAKNYSQAPQIEGEMDQPLLGGREVEGIATPLALAGAVAADKVRLEVGRLRLLLEGGDSGLQSAVQKAISVYDFVEAVGKDQRFDYRLQLCQAEGQVELALVRDGAPGELVKGSDAQAALAALRPQLENAYAVKCLSALDNPDPPFKVEVWANRMGKEEGPDEKLVQARVGELLRFNFRAERDCYLTLIDLGTSGKITVLFPNQYCPSGYIKGGETYRTGTKGDLPFQIRATGPAGRELVKVIATLDSLDLPSLKMGKAGGAGTRTIESGSEFVRQLVRDLSIEGIAPKEEEAFLPTNQWATDYVVIETSP